MKLTNLHENQIISTKDDVLRWLKENTNFNNRSLHYEIHDDLSVSFLGGNNIQVINRLFDGKLPIKFRVVNGVFVAAGINLTSLEGLPEHAAKDIIISNNPNLTTLSGIHKIVKSCNRDIVLTNCPIESNILGLMLIKGLRSIQYGQNDPDNSEFLEELFEAYEIINEHLFRSRDINLCQEELLEAGLSQYAKL